MVRRSSVFWVLCWIWVVIGVVCQFAGVYLEVAGSGIWAYT